MNLSGLIGSFPNTTVAVTRRAAGSFNSNGIYSGGATEVLPVKAVIHPATELEVARLSEGLRSKEAIGVSTAQLLLAADEESGTQADTLVYESRTYEVQKVLDFFDQAGVCLAIAVRM